MVYCRCLTVVKIVINLMFSCTPIGFSAINAWLGTYPHRGFWKKVLTWYLPPYGFLKERNWPGIYPHNYRFLKERKNDPVFTPIIMGFWERKNRHLVFTLLWVSNNSWHGIYPHRLFGKKFLTWFYLPTYGFLKEILDHRVFEKQFLTGIYIHRVSVINSSLGSHVLFLQPSGYVHHLLHFVQSPLVWN